MDNIWDETIGDFIEKASNNGVKMMLVGGAAVNFHGYQRHSSDVDFWIDTTEDNLKKLVTVFNEMGYEIDDFPTKVKTQEQNISIKFSPGNLDLELITKFSPGKTFEEAYTAAEQATSPTSSSIKWKVIAFDDLLTSKIKSTRPKDLLDVMELKRLKK
jgi:predicted nucleotidyltransferase component of viral defense system